MTNPVLDVMDFAKSKTRLFLEYILLAAFLSLCGFVGYLLIQNANKDTAIAKMDTRVSTLQNQQDAYKDANQNLEKNVAYLLLQREKDSSSVLKLMGEFKLFTEGNVDLQNKISNLENQDANVKNYLNTAIPDDLRSLLQEPNGTGGSVPNAGDKGHPEQGTSGQLRTGPTSTNPFIEDPGPSNRPK